MEESETPIARNNFILFGKYKLHFVIEKTRVFCGNLSDVFKNPVKVFL